MLGLGEIDSAVAPSLLCLAVTRRSGPLQESVDLKVWVWENKWEMEAVCREAVADDANFDRGHGIGRLQQ